MSESKRVLVFFQSFVLITVAMWVLGELYLLVTASPIADPNQARAAREMAGAAFGARYHLLMLLSSIVIAGTIAFRAVELRLGSGRDSSQLCPELIDSRVGQFRFT